MWFLYSVNDEKFYWKQLTIGGDEIKICLTKEEHNDLMFTNDFIVTGEQDGWDENFVKELCYKGGR